MNVCGFKNPSDTRWNCDLCTKIIFLFLLRLPILKLLEKILLFFAWNFIVCMSHFTSFSSNIHAIIYSLNISINTAPCRHIHNGTRAQHLPFWKETQFHPPRLSSSLKGRISKGFSHEQQQQHQASSKQVIANHIKAKYVKCAYILKRVCYMEFCFYVGKHSSFQVPLVRGGERMSTCYVSGLQCPLKNQRAITKTKGLWAGDVIDKQVRIWIMPRRQPQPPATPPHGWIVWQENLRRKLISRESLKSLISWGN